MRKIYNAIAAFLRFTRDHKVPIKAGKRWIGVCCALFGWFLIAVATVFFGIPITCLGLIGINAFVQFISGIIFILTGCIAFGLFFDKGLSGYKFLQIASKNIEALFPVYLSPKQRIMRIYFRGFVATFGYIIYEMAKVSIGIIDNSAIHGADALVYALTAVVFLKQRFNIREWIGALIAVLGMLFVLYLDLGASNEKVFAIVGYICGGISSITLSVIIILTIVIVQYDHPVRIAFHQCICGFIVSLCILLIFMDDISMYQISSFNYLNAVISGMCYAIALILFFYAFYYVEPIVIAISGSFLLVYGAIFESLLHKKLPEPQDIISAILIATGCIILVYEEHKRGKVEKPPT